jgi:hypothetical protein
MAHPHNRAVAERSAGYDYGPPTTQGDSAEDSGTPQDNSDAVVVDNEGETPMAPPPDADTITDPGGSPTDEILELHDPSITSLTPNTAVIGTEATVTLNGANFRDDSVVEVDQVEVSTAYVSTIELTATLGDPGAAGTASVSVRNPSSEMESNSVDFTWTAAGDLRTKNSREDSK